MSFIFLKLHNSDEGFGRDCMKQVQRRRGSRNKLSGKRTKSGRDFGEAIRPPMKQPRSFGGIFQVKGQRRLKLRLVSDAFFRSF